MKRLSLILLSLMLATMACQTSQKKSTEGSSEIHQFTVDEIQTKGYDYVGKEVAITGTVSHVCKHSGQRCFLMGSGEELTIRVEAGHQIGSFNQEQMGSDLMVTGVLQEIRIDDAYLAEMEAEAGTCSEEEAEHTHDGNHEVDGGNHDQDKQNQLAEMRQKIEASGKGYYSIFYLDGTKSEEVVN